MRKITLLLTFFALMRFGAIAQNLVLNPGFELGTADGSGQQAEFTNWDITNGNSLIAPTTLAGEPRTGTRAVKVNVTGTQTNAPQPWSMQLVSDPVATVSGSTYVLKVYVKTLLNQAGSINLSTNAKIGSNQQYLASQNTVYNTWTLLTWNVVANSSTTEFVLNMGSATNDYIIDDIEVTGPPAGGGGPIVVGPLNPSFELGSANGSGASAEFINWTILNGNDFIEPATGAGDARTGARALKVNSTGTQPNYSTSNQWSLQITTDPLGTTIGTVYTVKLYAKKLSTNAGSIRLSTNSRIGSNQQYFADRSINENWTLLTWTVTANSSLTEFVLDMGRDINTYLIDDVEITSPAPTPISCLVLNGGLENGSGDNFDNWGKWNNPGGNALVSTSAPGDVQSGTRALKAIVPGGNPWEVQFVSDAVATKVGVNYTFSFYIKGTTASGTTVRVSTNESAGAQYSPDFSVSGSYTKKTWTIRAKSESTRFAFDLGKNTNTYFIDDICLEVVCDGSFTPPANQTPIASGKAKFLGNVWSAAQLPNSNKYFNQVTPENAGKWGSVETADQVFNWTDLDAARKYASDNNFPFRFHVLFWGAQQPTWLKPLSNADKIRNIREWLAAISGRYKDDSGPFKKPEYVEVFNEVLNDPPNNLNNATPQYQFRANNTTDAASGDYVDALRSLNAELGTTPWEYDYVVNAFKLARQYFGCTTKLMINEYGVENDANTMGIYTNIVNALKAEKLVDAVGLQTHSFSTQIYGNYTTTSVTNRNANLEARLNQIAGAGLPVMVTELDIDGDVSLSSTGARVTTGTQADKDAFQRSEFENIFPIYWNHPSVIGVTMWGYRTGHWRSNQAAYLMEICSGAPRPAMNYLNTVIRASNPSVGNFPQTASCNLKPSIICKNATTRIASNGIATLSADMVTASATDPEGGVLTYTLSQSEFDCSKRGENQVTITVTDDAGLSTSCTATVTVIDDIAPTGSATATPAMVWPPNNKMVDINVDISSTDNCSGASCKIKSVTSNEGTPSDWMITGDKTLKIRASRNGNGNGRVYTITVECTDASGNTSTSSTTVTVVHDQRGRIGTENSEDTITIVLLGNPSSTTENINVQLLSTNTQSALKTELVSSSGTVIETVSGSKSGDIITFKNKVQPAIYFIRTIQNGKVATLKVVKQ
jgi:GH35 family endo-1,4-beta-xylanase